MKRRNRNKINLRGFKEKRGFNLDPETKRGIGAVVLFLLAVITLLSYFDKAGPFGFYFAQIVRFFVGKGFLLVVLVLFLGTIAFLKNIGSRISGFATIFGLALLFISILGILQIFYFERLAQQKTASLLLEAGGVIGYLISLPFVKLLGAPASVIIFIGLALIAFLIIFNFSLKTFFNFLRLSRFWRTKENDDLSLADAQSTLDKEHPEITANQHLSLERKTLLPKIITGLGRKIMGATDKEEEIKPRLSERYPEGRQEGLKEEKDEFSFDASDRVEGWSLPPLELLERDKGQPSSGDIKVNSNVIQRTLQNFGIEVDMGEINIGPTVTQYTLRPAEGIKLSRITALNNDLSLALAAHPIRIEAPIPGKSLVGIEIPNKAATKVRLGSLIDCEEFSKNHTFLTLALGRDVSGSPVFADLEKMPHLLIAGATGSGKTICLNSIILSLLYRHPPHILKFILIDPKRVEFPVYNGLPHLLTPVIVEPKKTVNVLRWLVSEMDRRFEILSGDFSRDILTYNKKRKDFSDWMSYIIVVIDELADLMASFGREIEAGIVRLAQMSRAVGIHLVVATQRPSVEVITGLIKANITSRVAFAVASQIDSRTILDAAGAEKLLGNGDMLFLNAENSKPKRVQGCLISDKEVKRVVVHLSKSADFFLSREKSLPNSSMLELDFKEKAGAKMIDFDQDGGTDEELLVKAKEIIFEANKASASLLQRRLKIGYARAARLLDLLEDEGVIGPSDGAKPREVYKE